VVVAIRIAAILSRGSVVSWFSGSVGIDQPETRLVSLVTASEGDEAVEGLVAIVLVVAGLAVLGFLLKVVLVGLAVKHGVKALFLD
jgi:hypothetical protein